MHGTLYRPHSCICLKCMDAWNRQFSTRLAVHRSTVSRICLAFVDVRLHLVFLVCKCDSHSMIQLVCSLSASRHQYHAKSYRTVLFYITAFSFYYKGWLLNQLVSSEIHHSNYNQIIPILLLYTDQTTIMRIPQNNNATQLPTANSWNGTTVKAKDPYALMRDCNANTRLV